MVRDAALVFEALPSFAGSGADLSSPGSDTLPADLAAWADAQAVPALAQTVTDGQGEAVFSQLVCGLYLVRQAGGAEGAGFDPNAAGGAQQGSDPNVYEADYTDVDDSNKQ